MYVPNNIIETFGHVTTIMFLITLQISRTVLSHFTFRMHAVVPKIKTLFALITIRVIKNPPNFLKYRLSPPHAQFLPSS